MPWIILTAISLILDIVHIILAFVFLMIISGVVGILFLALGIYFFICVWSFRYQQAIFICSILNNHNIAGSSLLKKDSDPIDTFITL